MAYTCILVLGAFSSVAAKCLESVMKRSYVAVWKWVQKYSDMAEKDRFRIEINARSRRRYIC
jgi:hypothetical protein